MDLTPILSLLSGLGPWGPVVGALVLLVYQFAKARWPTLPLPHIGPAPAPTPAQNSPLPAHPILDQLARLFGLEPRGGSLADEIRSVESIRSVISQPGSPPEPATPVPAK